MRGLLPLVAIAGLLVACQSSTFRKLKATSRVTDPAVITLQEGFNDYVRCARLDDGTQIGMIQCRDGSSSRYWFRSHHLTGDDGGTLFRFSDGTEHFMVGGFCCEVQLPQQQLASLAELQAFIRKKDGISP